MKQKYRKYTDQYCNHLRRLQLTTYLRKYQQLMYPIPDGRVFTKKDYPGLFNIFKRLEINNLVGNNKEIENERNKDNKGTI